MKHTPGPWEIAHEVDGAIAIMADGSPLIAVARYSDNPRLQRERGQANAALIAAAPEMLEALKSAVNYLDGFKGPFNHELLNLKSVIARAEGKP